MSVQFGVGGDSMAKVFISYGRENTAQADALANDLRELGHVVWYDSDLSGGQAWWDQILHRIRECEVFVLALSPHSVKSVACNKEWTYAHELRRCLLPVLVADGVSNDLLPPLLSQIQYTDYRRQDKAALMRLMKAVNALPAAQSLPDPLPASPEVPISYLGRLREQIETGNELSFQAQSALLVEIAQGLRDPDQQEVLQGLLRSLRARKDLFARVADQIDAMLDDGAQPLPAAAAPLRSATRGTAAKKDATATPERRPASTSPPRASDSTGETIVGGAKELRDFARLVRACFGPRGRPVRLATVSGEAQITSRPLQAIEHYAPVDPIAAANLKLIVAAAMSTHNIAGAGAATTVLLAQAIIERAGEVLLDQASPDKFIKSMEKAAEACVEEIKKLARPCREKNELTAIASHAAREERTTIFTEAVEKVGLEGPITIEAGKSVSDELEIVEGMRFDRGYLSPHFVKEASDLTATLEDACVLEYHGKIRDIRPLRPLLEQVAKSGKSLLIIAEDVEGEALDSLVDLCSRGIIRLAAVRAPGFGDRRTAMLEDIAILTGGTVYGGESGPQLDRASLEGLGRTRRAIVEKEYTTLIDASGDPSAIKARVEQIRRQSEETSSDYDREKLQERLAKLAGGVAIVKVGAATAAHCVERTKCLNTALRAVTTAIESGAVPGAGHALLRAAKAVAGASSKGDVDEASTIVLQACQEPFLQLVRNAGEDADKALTDVLKKREAGFGFDPATGKLGDLYAAGVIDSAQSMCFALQNAVWASKTVLWSSLTP